MDQFVYESCCGIDNVGRMVLIIISVRWITVWDMW